MKEKLYFGAFFGALAVYGFCCYELGKFNSYENLRSTKDWKIGVEEPDDGDGAVIKIVETCKDGNGLRTRYSISPEVAKKVAKELMNIVTDNSSDIVGGDEDEAKEDEA